ncbi:DUF4138 domain-containing protein [Nafulsella turpanensis]|uniref:DUF4138 domain-containing protein n=1 Tax=Nafulsella turpanensis TaxID=1265690 RepID=UPI000346745E|nr:DUF4138 domain-containing protein [Nafulsella turpanensis]
MKNMMMILLSVFGFLLGPQGSQAQQQTDTLYVSARETTYLLFPEAVALVDIGRAGEYAARIEGQSVFLKALHEQAGPTNLLVRYGTQQYFTAKLQYNPQPPASLHDFRQQLALQEEKIPEALNPQQDFQARLARVMARKDDRLKHLGRNQLQLELTHLLQDEQATYVGLTIENLSSIRFQPDFIGFSLMERKGKGFWRKRSRIKELQPYLSQRPEVVGAGEKSRLFFVLPQYALASGGRLLIEIREKQGSRILRMVLPARMINHANRFSHEAE